MWHWLVSVAVTVAVVFFLGNRGLGGGGLRPCVFLVVVRGSAVRCRHAGWIASSDPSAIERQLVD